MARGMERSAAVTPAPHPPAAVTPAPVLSGMVRPVVAAPAPPAPAARTARRISHTRGKT